VAPQVAVISVGADNRYHLPNPEIESRYHTAGACVLRTDRCGAITITTDGSTLRVRAQRPACACPSATITDKRGEASPSPARGLGASEERSAAQPREHRTGPRYVTPRASVRDGERTSPALPDPARRASGRCS
jgi:hypothetical protein